MEFRRVQSWVLSFTCCIQPTFQPYSPNTPHLVTSVLMLCRRSSMVHLLISSLTGRIDALSQDLHLLMSSNRLSLNPNKTQFIWFGTPQQLSKLDLPLLIETFPSFTFHSSVRNLGVVLDSTLTFSEHVANLTRSSYFHLRRLRAIRR